MDGRPTWTDCDEAGDYIVPNVLSPRDLVYRPDNMGETVPHTYIKQKFESCLFTGSSTILYRISNLDARLNNDFCSMADQTIHFGVIKNC